MNLYHAEKNRTVIERTQQSNYGPRRRVFLLSPANLAGVRAGYLLSENGKSPLACRLRAEGAPLGEVFSFISALYFRGKVAYSQAFSAPPPASGGSFVITACAGLITPETVVTLDRLREMAASDIDATHEPYRAPLDRDCRLLKKAAGDDCDVVLLGSIATPKYVEPLLQIFGERLVFPAEFVGRGDMSRGGLMLRCVTAKQELTYIPSLHVSRRGPRPPKLLPVASHE